MAAIASRIKWTDYLKYWFWGTPPTAKEVAGISRSFVPAYDKAVFLGETFLPRSDLTKYLSDTKLATAGSAPSDDAEFLVFVANILQRLKDQQAKLTQENQQNEELDQQINDIERKLAACRLKQRSFFYRTFVYPFVVMFSIPNPMDGLPDRINPLAFLWLPKYFDAAFECWDRLCDAIAGIGKTALENKKDLLSYSYQWWTYFTTKPLSYLLRLIVKPVQQIFNMVFHPFDTFFKPFFDIYKMATDPDAKRRIRPEKAIGLILLQLLKLLLIAAAIASVFGGPFAPIISAAVNAIMSLPILAPYTTVVAALTPALGTATGLGFIPGALNVATATAPALIAATVVLELPNLLIDPYTAKSKAGQYSGTRFIMPSSLYHTTRLFSASSQQPSDQVTNIDAAQAQHVLTTDQQAAKHKKGETDVKADRSARSSVGSFFPRTTARSSAAPSSNRNDSKSSTNEESQTPNP